MGIGPWLDDIPPERTMEQARKETKAWALRNCKFAQDAYALFDLVNKAYDEILGEYFGKRKKGSMMSWSVVPFGRLRKIWNDFAKFGFVRDEAGVNRIAEQIVNNIARISAATDLSGHGTVDPKEIMEERGFDPIEDDNVDFYFGFLNTKYGQPFTDVGLLQMWPLASDLLSATTSEKKLMAIDRILNVVHQRGDLAALFLEGGSSSLSELSGLKEAEGSETPENKDLPGELATLV